MDDDFNTPMAIAVLFELARECNREKSANPDRAILFAHQLKEHGALLGLLQRDAEEFFQSDTKAGDDVLSAEQIEDLIQQRKDARANKNFAEADRIRDELVANGVVLEDGEGGTIWRRQ